MGITLFNQPSAFNTNHASKKDSLKEAFKYTLVSALSLGALGSLYYFGVCDSDQPFTGSCGSSLASFKINLGLPLLAFGAIYKAQEAFRRNFRA